MCAALLAAGCGDGSDDEAPLTASAKTEAAWTDKVLGWVETFTWASAYADCKVPLTSIVGPPPSRPLEQIAGVADDMCADFARWHAAQGKARGTGDETTGPEGAGRSRRGARRSCASSRASPSSTSRGRRS